MRRLLSCSALALLIAIPGCERPSSRVQGAVTFQGKPLAGAVVTLFGPDNQTHTADTGPDGRYQVAGVHRGAVRVSVQVPPPRQKPRPDPVAGKAGDSPARNEDLGKAARLPPAPPPLSPPPSAGGVPVKYADPNTSGLAFELKEAEQTYDIDLK